MGIVIFWGRTGPISMVCILPPVPAIMDTVPVVGSVWELTESAPPVVSRFVVLTIWWVIIYPAVVVAVSVVCTVPCIL
jgi:hypothetical protein